MKLIITETCFATTFLMICPSVNTHSTAASWSEACLLLPQPFVDSVLNSVQQYYGHDFSWCR